MLVVAVAAPAYRWFLLLLLLIVAVAAATTADAQYLMRSVGSPYCLLMYSLHTS